VLDPVMAEAHIRVHTLDMAEASSSFDWGKELPRLVGPRLDLHPLRPCDARAVFEIFGDPKVAEYWSSPAMEDLAEAVALIDEVQRCFDARLLFQWGLCLRETDELIGTCTLCKLDHPNRHAELGFALNRKYWGQGLAMEAVALLVDFAFEKLDLHRLEADVDPNNAASLALLEKLGFQREGYLRERWHIHGGVHDAVLLGLLRHERPGAGSQ